jgi:tetratricopeptide (TPR) repeat protein
MKRIMLSLYLGLAATWVLAQTEDAEKLYENGKMFMRQGDYANASLILSRALSQAPDNIEIAKDLSFDYYLQKENDKALATLKPFLEKDNSDDQTYEIGGTIYRAMGQNKDAEKLYKKALKNYPEDGALYNDYGEMLWDQQDYSAIKLWEKGIQMDPSFPGNYYNACKYYYLSTDKIWSLIYGEIFVNLESFTARTAEIKDILLAGYKKLFADQNLLADTKNKNDFEIAFLTVMNKQNDIVSNGIDAETLTMIRTRFILDWDQNYAEKFPFALFNKQRQYLEEGVFPAYNEWIFGAGQNLAKYQNWIGTHPEESSEFTKFLQGSVFRIPKGQYYH